MALLQQNGGMRLFCGFATKKVTATMSSLSSIVVLWRRQWLEVIFCFLFLWCFWFSSLELKINNEMVVLFFVEGWNG
jgi:hypothetical protein